MNLYTGLVTIHKIMNLFIGLVMVNNLLSPYNIFGSSFYDAFSVTRLYSVDDRVTG
jgi:hypothetical protein